MESSTRDAREAREARARDLARGRHRVTRGGARDATRRTRATRRGR
jgi:hypothetical protein